MKTNIETALCYRLLALAIMLMCSGCGQDHPSANPKPDTAKQGPDDIMVSVNDATLTRSTLARDVDVRLSASVGKGLTEADLKMARRKATIDVVDQFVKRELLLAQADIAGVKITEAEEKMAFEQIRERVEQGGRTLDDVMKNSPFGAEYMRNEVIVGLKITKFLSQTLSPDTHIDDKDFAAFKAEHKDALTKPETVDASHILVSASREDAPDENALKRARIEGLRQKLLDGTNFSDLARSDSDCPSRQQGGHLGEFPRGKMLPELEDAAFSQTPGEIGDIIETSSGFHIVQVISHHAPALFPDEQIREAAVKYKRTQELLTLLGALKEKATLTYSDELMDMMKP